MKFQLFSSDSYDSRAFQSNKLIQIDLLGLNECFGVEIYFRHDIIRNHMKNNQMNCGFFC